MSEWRWAAPKPRRVVSAVHTIGTIHPPGGGRVMQATWSAPEGQRHRGAAGLSLPTLVVTVLDACVGPERLEAGLLGGNGSAGAWAAATAPLGGFEPEDVVGVFRAAADSLVDTDEFEVQPCEGVSAALVISGVAGRGMLSPYDLTHRRLPR